MSAANDFSIRRARPDEPERVAALVDSVWRGTIRERRPHLFTSGRMADYLLCEGADGLWGVAAAYPFDVRINGVTFRMAGIGQVITRPDRRGLGVMTALLERALSDLRAEGADAAWLLGDRLRYSHFGFSPGGRTIRFVAGPRYLPAAPPENTVREMDLAGELDRIQGARAALPTAVRLLDEELALALGGFGIHGWALRDSFALFSRNGDRMVLASGRADELALLLAHQMAENAQREEGPREIVFDAPHSPCLLGEVGRRVYATFTVANSADFRVLTPHCFAEKAARCVAGRVPAGADVVCLQNADTGEAVTLRARGGSIRVTHGESAPAVSLTPLQLTEAFFDWLPNANRLPHLKEGSPLRALFPLDFHMTWFDSILP